MFQKQQVVNPSGKENPDPASGTASAVRNSNLGQRGQYQ